MKRVILLLLLACPARADIKFTILPAQQTGLAKIMSDWKDLETSRGNTAWQPWGIRGFQLTPTIPAFFATQHSGPGGSILIRCNKNPDGLLSFIQDKQIDNRLLPTTFRPVAFDFNNDGSPDIFSCYDSVRPHWLNTAGVLTALPRYNPGAWSQGTIADVNGDGFLDYRIHRVAYGKTTVTTFTNNKNNTFTRSDVPLARPSGLPPQVTAKLDQYLALNSSGGPVFWEGDFNGDGRPDVIVNYYGEYATANFFWGAICLRNAAGVLEDPTPELTIIGNPELPPRDLDGDGRLDLLTSHVTGAGIYLQKQAGVLTKAALPFLEATIQYPYEVRYLDLDKDGDTDLYISNARGGQSRIYEQTAPGVFTQKYALFHWDAEGFDFVDLNGDGNLDLVIGGGLAKDTTGFEVTVFLNDSAAPEPLPPPPPPPPPPVVETIPPPTNLRWSGDIAKPLLEWDHPGGAALFAVYMDLNGTIYRYTTTEKKLSVYGPTAGQIRKFWVTAETIPSNTLQLTR